MAPKRGESLERNEEYEEFHAQLTKYHEQRGTHFEAEPRVGIRHIDLLKLYKRVVEEGGYDLCSDTKAKPLMWRKLAEEFVGKNVYTAAQAFQIKSVYYKNLCAYEISKHWGKEPPPKEVLEEVTAKGGNVMGRTLENYQRPISREQENLQGDDSESEQETPKQEKQEKAEDDFGSASRTRGLRQQPPQRVLFQPDSTSSRNSRSQMANPQGSPVPTSGINGVINASSYANGASSTLASYEPSQSYPLSLKPVITPANNPEFYRNERKRKLDATAGPLAKKYRNIMLPGTGFIGPNIYVRAQLALQSGIPEEEQYALHHLVKISHERGDKYRFDQFPGLADALVRKTLQISGLFYNVEWDVSYDDEMIDADDDVLNGLRGTSDVVQKLRSRVPLITDDTLLDADFLAQLNRITEAALVIRNMCMLEENANYLSKHPLILDCLSVILHLPKHPDIIEVQHYALETGEQVLKYRDIGSEDALYHALLSQLDGQDRGAIVVALRCISRIAMYLPPPKRLDYISDEILQRVQDWLLIEDEELRSSGLDFLMQYTSFSDNVDNLLQAVDADALLRQLGRLLFFAAKEHKDVRPSTQKEKDDGPYPVPRLSRGIVKELLKLDEPRRSSEWLWMCFLPEPASEMTQISLWQAYQATFAPFHYSHPHLIAGDFIKNVSNTFTGATAQVAGSNKYVIKGIKARKIPVEMGARGVMQTKELQKCCWKHAVEVPGQRDPVTGVQSPSRTEEKECGEWSRTADDMLQHILSSHLQIPQKQNTTTNDGDKMEVDSQPPSQANGLTNGTAPSRSTNEVFDFQAANEDDYRCKWADCHRSSKEFDDNKATRIALLARHIKTHLPSSGTTQLKHNVKPGTNPPTSEGRSYYTTLQDEKGDAAGVALGAALVLRNIAKFMPRQDAPQNADGVTGEGKVDSSQQRKDHLDDADLVLSVFNDDVREQLFYAVANNRTIKDYVGNVLRLVKSAG